MKYYSLGFTFMEDLILNRTLDGGLYPTLMWAERCSKDIKRLNGNHYTQYVIGCNDALIQFLSRHRVKV